MSGRDWDEIRRAITNAYYDARNTGGTMETAADRATDAVVALIEADPAEVKVRAATALRDELLSFNIGHGDYRAAGRMLGAALEHPDKPEGYTP